MTPITEVLERWGPSCVWCAVEFDGRARPSREHLLPSVKGGPNWRENLVPACSRCNRERGTSSPVQWAQELEQRGRTPRHDVIERSLLAVAGRIAAEGGARRIRGALAAELRKLGHPVPF